MAWPSTSGTIPANQQGTTLLADATDDHSLAHRQLGSLVNSLPTVFGTTGGTNILQYVSSAGQFIPAINSGGTLAGNLFGTFTLMAGTVTGQIKNNGTIANGVYGTALYQGGTVQGTIANNALVNGGTYGTPTFNVWNGWVNANETGTMLGTLSANGIFTGTLQVGATASSKYDKGDKLNFTQGGTNMYAYVYSIPTGTTLLITGGTDYAPGTTAITNLQYSKAESPNGFPGTFNYTPNETWTGTAPTGNTLRSAQFYMRGNLVYYIFNSSYGTAGSATKLTINQPIPSLISSSTYHDYGNGWTNNATNGSFTGGANPTILFSNTIIQMGPSGAQGWQATFLNGFYAV